VMFEAGSRDTFTRTRLSKQTLYADKV
jgi:hypothetical protein